MLLLLLLLLDDYEIIGQDRQERQDRQDRQDKSADQVIVFILLSNSDQSFSIFIF